MDAHYEVSIAYDINGARVEEFEIVEEQDEVPWVNGSTTQRGKVST